jgi:hypothetical protein
LRGEHRSAVRGRRARTAEAARGDGRPRRLPAPTLACRDSEPSRKSAMRRASKARGTPYAGTQMATAVSRDRSPRTGAHPHGRSTGRRCAACCGWQPAAAGVAPRSPRSPAAAPRGQFSVAASTAAASPIKSPRWRQDGEERGARHERMPARHPAGPHVGPLIAVLPSRRQVRASPQGQGIAALRATPRHRQRPTLSSFTTLSTPGADHAAP